VVATATPADTTGAEEARAAATRVSGTTTAASATATASRAAAPGSQLRFTGLPVTCESCHRDPHAGQFARAGQGTACERCHSSETTRAVRFDHRRDSAYKLDGAHAKLACTACHRTVSRPGGVHVLYKPLPTKCSGCHKNGASSKGERL
jgi:hypothetical protein